MEATSRRDQLEKVIRQLDNRLLKLELLDRHYSWYRLVIILIGGAATWITASFLGKNWGWGVFIASLAGFALVVRLHRRLDEWIDKFQAWKEIKSDQLARLRIDWSAIPLPLHNQPIEKKPLEIDLDLTGSKSLHHLLDMSISVQGGMRLANWITNGNPDVDRIYYHQKLVRELRTITRFRERLLLTFKLASKEALNGDALVKWLDTEVPYDKLKRNFIISAVLVSLNVVLFLFNSADLLPPLWMFSLAIYGLFYFANVKTIYEFLNAVVILDTELDKFRSILNFLEKYDFGENKNLLELCSIFKDPDNLPSKQLSGVKFITFGAGLRMNPIMGFILNILTPWDFFFALLARKSRRQLVNSLPVWLDIWYSLESLISLANFSYLHPDYIFPEIEIEAWPVFEAEALGHPLIPEDRKSCNNFQLSDLGEIAVITGSNMAGKSTFIKTVGINLCLAYAGGPVNAAYFHCRPFRMHTCINISDSITDGISYFYAEVKCLKRLMVKLTESNPYPLLYLIDEIFRGTNNRERLIGSQAYIREAVGKNGIGLLATHDLELANIAENTKEVQNYHFSDAVVGEALHFDYKIRPGSSPTTNALKIMELEGLPTE